MNMRRRGGVGVVLLLGLISLTAMGRDLLADEADGPRLKYRVGEGLYLDDGGNQAHLQGRFQGRFTFTKLQAAVSTTTFSVPRAEIRIDGFTLGKKLKFGFEMNLATRNRATTTAVCTNAGCTTTADAVTTESTSGLAVLNDYYADWVPTPYFGIQVGQFQVPFLIQQLTSITKQQFVDRSLSTGFFDFGRDVGASIHGGFWKNKLSYAVFLMNGDGANNFNRNDRALMVGSRLEAAILGEYKPVESDVDYSEQPNLGVGIAYAFNERGDAFENGTIVGFAKAHHGTIDVGFKYRGFSFQGAGMASRTVGGTKFTNWGYNAQAGYFVIPKTFEIAAKAGGAIFATAPHQYEYSAGFNYFIKGHGIKFQTDYALLRNNRGAGLTDHRVRTAMNVVF